MKYSLTCMAGSKERPESAHRSACCVHGHESFSGANGREFYSEGSSCFCDLNLGMTGRDTIAVCVCACVRVFVRVSVHVWAHCDRVQALGRPHSPLNSAPQYGAKPWLLSYRATREQFKSPRLDFRSPLIQSSHHYYI